MGETTQIPKFLFEKLLQEHHKSLIGYATKILGQESVAQEVVQWAYLQLWQQDWREIEDQESQWLYAVTRNKCLDYKRSSESKNISLDQTDEIRDDGLSAENIVYHKNLRVIIEQGLAGLPQEQQQILRLKFDGELSNTEIAKSLGISTNHVGVLVHRALGYLRKHIAVICLLLAIPMGLSFFVTNFVSRLSNAQAKQTKIAMGEIGKGLDMFYEDCRFYPSTQMGLKALSHAVPECKNWGPEPYMKSIPLDGWSNEFIYESSGSSYFLKSLGADGQVGGRGKNADTVYPE